MSNALCSVHFVASQTIEFDEGAGAVLRIQPLRAPRDENIYECVARNSEGEISVTAKLAIIRGNTHMHTVLFHLFSAVMSSFSGLSAVDVTIKQCRTLPAHQAAGSCSFYSPFECTQA